MELRPYGITVSVAYPPDTETPGFAIENVSKPEETRLISESSGLFSANKVAQDIISGMRAGDFSIYTGLDGWMLANLTAGLCPASSFAEGALQVLLMPLLRLISLFYVAQFDGIARNGKIKREASKKAS